MDLTWETEEDLGNPFTISSSRFFASANQDGSFGGNCGFWLPPIRVLDKLRFYHGGEALQTDTISIDPGVVQLSGKVDGKSWNQTYFCPIEEAACVVQFESDLDSVSIELESKYLKASSPLRTEKGVTSWNHEDKVIQVENEEEGYYTTILSDTSIDFDENDKKINLGSDDVAFVVSGSLESKSEAEEIARELMSSQEDILEEKKEFIEENLHEIANFDSPDEKLNKSFSWAKFAMEKLYHEGEVGGGYFAGLPAFPNFFGRDTVWSVLGLNSSGRFENVRESLETLGKVQSEEKGRCKLEGEIPHEFSLDGERVHYNSSDGSLLWVKGVHDYLKWSGDEDFLSENYEKIKKAIKWAFEKDENGDLFVENWMELFSDSVLFLIDTSWMDTTIRWKAAVDIQGIFHEALTCGAELADRMDDDEFAQTCRDTADKLKKKINEVYWNEDEDYFYDKKGLLKMGGSTTSNPIILALFDVADEEKKEKVLEKIGSEEFTTDWGVRSVSEDDFLYIPGGWGILSYHNGKVWPLITGWCCAAEYKTHKPEIAKKQLDSFKKLTEIGSPGVLPETVRGDKLEPADCYHQAWSSAMLVYDVVSGLLGIEPDSFNNKVKIEPHLPDDWDYASLDNLLIGDNSVDLSFSKRDDGWEVVLRSEEPIEVNLSMPGEFESVEKDGNELSVTKEENSGCIHTRVDLEIDGESELIFS